MSPSDPNGPVLPLPPELQPSPASVVLAYRNQKPVKQSSAYCIKGPPLFGRLASGQGKRPRQLQICDHRGGRDSRSFYAIDRRPGAMGTVMPLRADRQSETLGAAIGPAPRAAARTVGLNRDQARALVTAADRDCGRQALRTAAVVRLPLPHSPRGGEGSRGGDAAGGGRGPRPPTVIVAGRRCGRRR